MYLNKSYLKSLNRLSANAKFDNTSLSSLTFVMVSEFIKAKILDINYPFPGKTHSYPSPLPAKNTGNINSVQSRHIAKFSAMWRLCFCGIEINKMGRKFAVRLDFI